MAGRIAHASRLTLLAAAAALLAACQSPAPASTPASTPPGGALLASAGGNGGGCAPARFADPDALPAQSKLPDPFRFSDGRRVATRADWACRRAELSAQVQHYELGARPEPSAAAPVQARMEGQDLVVSISENGKSVSFPARIQLPAGAGANGGNHGPYPAIIGMGMVSLDNAELQRMGVALITFPNKTVGEQMGGASRGKGLFYELYGQDHPASAMTAWSWGVSRLIDALEKTPAAGIDARRLAVTGCSRNGKGAIVAGALDERIGLTIAQESGAGGAASWRISEAQKKAGQNVQTLRQIVQENVWFTPAFGQFAESAERLPFDQHEVMGLIAPRGLLVLENTSMEWLGNESAWVDALASREIWKALGKPEAMGVSQVGGHEHCRLPASEYGVVDAFARRFLLGDADAPTREVHDTDGGFAPTPAAWIDWRTPALR
jgi:hypothetical protein